MKKIEIDAKIFEQKYIDENLSLGQMADFFHCSTGTIKTWIKKLGLIKTAEAIKAKMAATNIEKYGVPYPAQNKEIRARQKETCRERYGADSPLSNKDIQDKIRHTNLKKYGSIYPSENENIVLKRQNTLVSEESYKILLDKEKFKECIIKNKLKTFTSAAEFLGCALSTIVQRVEKYNLRDYFEFPLSSGEARLREMISGWGISVQKNRSIIYPYEIDIYCPEQGLGIEFNGNYWHGEERVKKDYHLRKSRLAQEKGIFLYHVFEYEWDDIKKRERIINQIKNLLKLNKNRIYARQCEVVKLNAKEKNAFFAENHVQGADKSFVAYGLKYNGETVAAMSFCRSRFNKNYKWELSRFCCKKDFTIVGGASKLFKTFLNNHEGNIITYSDIAKTKGNLYSLLGFRFLRFSSPNYVWCNGKKFLTRYQTQMKNEVKIMKERDYWRVYDCGNMVWTYDR